MFRVFHHIQIFLFIEFKNKFSFEDFEKLIEKLTPNSKQGWKLEAIAEYPAKYNHTAHVKFSINSLINTVMGYHYVTGNYVHFIL